MRQRHKSAAIVLALAAGVAHALTADTAAAQRSDVPPLTLQTWADDSWLRFTDRYGMADGRFSRAGLLQRFNRRMDAQYDVNLLTTRWAPDDDAEWHAHAKGVRIVAGSFERAEMATGVEVKTSAALARRWTIGVDARSLHDLENRHDIASVRITRALAHGLDAYVGSSLLAKKSDMDGTAGIGWTRRGVRARADISVLDYPNNVVSGNARLLRDLLYDSTYRYSRQPVALRTAVTTALGRSAWAELQVAEVAPGNVHIESLLDSSGAVQAERAGYQGVLLGRRVGHRAQIAVTGTRIRARTERSPLAPDTSALDDYVLAEETRQAGVLATDSPGPRIHAAFLATRTSRTELRRYRRPGATDVDYADRVFDARLVTRYGAVDGGLQLVVDAGLADTRNVRGLGQVPGRQPVSHYELARAALMIGWRGPSRTEIMLGTRLEHDIDVPGGTLHRGLAIAGFQGRGMMYW